MSDDDETWDAKHLLPDWCGAEYLSGNCPVQAEGVIDNYHWYFRARGNHWTIDVSESKKDAIVGIRRVFHGGEDYGDSPYAAGWMPKEEAAAFIVRELERFKASRG